MNLLFFNEPDSSYNENNKEFLLNVVFLMMQILDKMEITVNSD